MCLNHFGWLGKYLALLLCGVLQPYDVVKEANDMKAFNYCNDDKCPENNKHIMCRLYKPVFPFDYLNTCTMMPDFMPLRPEWAASIVKYINKKRGLISLGLAWNYEKTQSFARAANYMKLNWDQKLATLSQLVAGYTCDPPDKFVDACCHTLKYPKPKMFYTTAYYKFPGWYLQHRNASLVWSKFNELKMEETLRLIFDEIYLDVVGNNGQLPRYDGNLYSYSIEAIGCGYSVKRYNETATSFTLVCYVSPYDEVPNPNGEGTVLWAFFKPSKKPSCPNSTIKCTDMSSFGCACPPGTYPDDQCLCIKYKRDPDLCDVDICSPDPPMFPMFGQWDYVKPKLAMRFSKTNKTYKKATTNVRNRKKVRKENLFSKQRKLRLHRVSKEVKSEQQKHGADIAKFIETLNMLEEKLKKIKLDDEKKKIIHAKIKKIIEISDEKQIIKDIFNSEPATTKKVIDEKSDPTSTASPVKLYEKILEHRQKNKHYYDDLEYYENKDHLPKQESYVGLYSDDYYDESKLNGIDRPLYLNTNFVDPYKEHNKTEILSFEEMESVPKSDVEENIDENDHFYGDSAYDEDYQPLKQVTKGRPQNENHNKKLKNEFGVANNLKHGSINTKAKDAHYDYDNYYDRPQSDYDYDENDSEYEYYDYVEDLVEERKIFYEKKLRAFSKAKPL